MIFDKLPNTDLDGNYRLFPAKKSLELTPNKTTCFVGCNGSGKSTLIEYIIQYIKKNNLALNIFDPYNPFIKELTRDQTSDTYYISFDKDQEEGVAEDYMLRKLFVRSQSTGESIVYRFGGTLTALGQFIRKPENSGKTLYIFFDDCDAGTSIDIINDITDVFNLITSDCQNNNITYYIVLTANSYEMCKSADIRIDVNTFEPIEFTSYEQYKKFVLKSRARKDRIHEQK